MNKKAQLAEFMSRIFSGRTPNPIQIALKNKKGQPISWPKELLSESCQEYCARLKSLSRNVKRMTIWLTHSTGMVNDHTTDCFRFHELA